MEIGSDHFKHDSVETSKNTGKLRPQQFGKTDRNRDKARRELQLRRDLTQSSLTKERKTRKNRFAQEMAFVISCVSVRKRKPIVL